MSKSVLYISYNGMLEEILSSQTIPYLRKLSKKGYDFTLLTFEKPQMLKDAGRIKVDRIKRELKDHGIEWRWLKYHKRMPLLATSFDTIAGAIYASYLAVRKRAVVVHARSVVPAAMALGPKFLGAKFIFDTRGLLADEYAGSGHWQEGSLKYRITKFFEGICARLSDYIIVLTNPHFDYLAKLPAIKRKGAALPIEVIPCCVDLDRFKSDPEDARRLRERENLSGSFIFTYLGKLGKYYMFYEMIDFIKEALGLFPNLKFMVITQNDPQEIYDMAAEKGLESGKVIIKKPEYREVPGLISISDLALFFINPNKKFGSFPIKFGEFLSCGIPVVINEGVGDTDKMVVENKLGVVVEKFGSPFYRDAIRKIKQYLEEDKGIKDRCRQAAESRLSLDSGVDKYYRIYSYLTKGR